MSRSLTAQDRTSLIRLASSLQVGDPTRKAILAGLKSATLSVASLDHQKMADILAGALQSGRAYSQRDLEDILRKETGLSLVGSRMEPIIEILSDEGSLIWGAGGYRFFSSARPENIYEDRGVDLSSTLQATDIADAIFLRSGRRGGDFAGRQDLLDIAFRELQRYGHSKRDVDLLLDQAILEMVKSRDLIPVNGGYRFPR